MALKCTRMLYLDGGCFVWGRHDFTAVAVHRSFFSLASSKLVCCYCCSNFVGPNFEIVAKSLAHWWLETTSRSLGVNYTENQEARRSNYCWGPLGQGPPDTKRRRTMCAHTRRPYWYTRVVRVFCYPFSLFRRAAWRAPPSITPPDRVPKPWPVETLLVSAAESGVFSLVKPVGESMLRIKVHTRPVRERLSCPYTSTS